jgi:dephospho-CoA kinase
LLVENSLYKKANRVLVVDVSPETQLKRTMQRDDVTREHVEQILAAQATREARLAVADDVIDNNRMLSHRMLPACTHTICSLRRSLSHRKNRNADPGPF